LVAAFLLSLVYNAVGLTFAVTGQLSPLVTALLMPLSSWSVVAVAWGAMKLREKKIVLTP
jgi:Cu+-exporting ATPase